MALAELHIEWERIEALGQNLLRMRNGQEVQDADITRLKDLQINVETARASGAWSPAIQTDLCTLEFDVLSLTVAPEVVPRIAWMFQSLQPGTPQPHATPALIQDLLMLNPTETPDFYALLSDASPLRQQDLIRVERDGPFASVRPGSTVVNTLLGRAKPVPAPPGTSRVTTKAQWNDLVLPADCLARLREFLLYLRHRNLVIDEWGGSFSGGPIGLFAGPSGTGKTYAASVLSSELGWPLYQIDLGRLVSKYIGETEENLNKLFDAAHGKPMILQFDEADSLFSKRGEVREARDRYANMEVSHLLARIERHDGPCILTTNLRTHLDKAFSRRFQAVIDFPRPDASARQRLWERLLPPRAPRDADLDLETIATSVNLTGGGIRNAAVHAAFIAADESRPIALRHIALAVWRELSKEGRPVSLSELGHLAGCIGKET